MIIFGSSANNFVDGMSNGVAFANSLSNGLSVGIACIAQQFPQELGKIFQRFFFSEIFKYCFNFL